MAASDPSGRSSIVLGLLDEVLAAAAACVDVQAMVDPAVRRELQYGERQLTTSQYVGIAHRIVSEASAGLLPTWLSGEDTRAARSIDLVALCGALLFARCVTYSAGYDDLPVVCKLTF